jgi:hypothetical protein
MAEGIEKRIIEIRKDGWEGCVMGQRRRISGCGGKSNGNESRVGGDETEVGMSSKEKYR